MYVLFKSYTLYISYVHIICSYHIISYLLFKYLTNFLLLIHSQQWRLAAEYSCDRAALLVAQDVNVVAGAMLKLFAGTSRATNTQAFIDQSREYEQLLKDANPLVRNSIKMQQRTHPLPVKRVAELEKWFASDEYKSLVSREE